MPRACLSTTTCPGRKLWFMAAPCLHPQSWPKVTLWRRLKCWDLLGKHISRQLILCGGKTTSISNHFSLEGNRWRNLGFKSLRCHQDPRHTTLTLQRSNTMPPPRTGTDTFWRDGSYWHSKRQMLWNLNSWLGVEHNEKRGIMKYIKLPEMFLKK